MESRDLAVHRTIVAVDVAGFGEQRRTSQDRLTIRDGLYDAVKEAFLESGIPWSDGDHEDTGDGMFVLVAPEVPKSLFAELLPSAMVNALRRYNSTHPESAQIRLRMALHAGEINYDRRGVTAASINLTFRLLDSAAVKAALAKSPGILALVTSSWFWDEVVRQNPGNAAKYVPAPVTNKETITTGWICLPDQPDQASLAEPFSSPASGPAGRPRAADHATKVRDALSTAATSALREQITPAGDMPTGLTIPSLGDGYVDHRIRVTEITSSADPGRESWWSDISVRQGACNFLMESILSRELSAAPTVLLGQPGSGKSVLTRILAARFSAAGYLAVRIELRQAVADEDLQSQIESAIHRITGENAQWPEISESSDGPLRVVIFDGFDELLQATGVVHNDFLLRLQDFQEREGRLGRPLAVIVTSRTAVTDRVRFPPRTTAIRLEPFDDSQITEWLKIWAGTNSTSLAERDLRPLPAPIALSYGELAEQPLLLLMLALYDADTNVLQQRSTAMSRTELYSRLLKDFARREIRKNSPALPEDILEVEVEDELLRLSVVALAMFNRRSQWVPEADLELDFSALLVSEITRKPETSPVRAELTMAQLTVGRFFFVHEARATHRNRPLRTYEFLHATFGEFLVARMVAQVLNQTDQGMLFALLSFEALTSRGPVVTFLGDLISQLDTRQRTDIADLVLRLHHRALFQQPETAYSHYEPLTLPVTARHAAWSANLVILAVLAAGEITGSQLFPFEPEVQPSWRAQALVWRSQLAGYGWEGLHETISFERTWDGQRQDFKLSRLDETLPPKDLDMSWTFNAPLSPEMNEEIVSHASHNSPLARRKINFVSNMSEDVMAHDLAALTASFPVTVNTLVVLDGERRVTASHALIAALCAPYQEVSLRDKKYLDLAQVAGKLINASNSRPDMAYPTMALGVLLSAVGQRILSNDSIGLLAEIISDVTTADGKLSELLAELSSLLADYEHQ